MRPPRPGRPGVGFLVREGCSQLFSGGVLSIALAVTALAAVGVTGVIDAAVVRQSIIDEQARVTQGLYVFVAVPTNSQSPISVGSCENLRTQGAVTRSAAVVESAPATFEGHAGPRVIVTRGSAGLAELWGAPTGAGTGIVVGRQVAEQAGLGRSSLVSLTTDKGSGEAGKVTAVVDAFPRKADATGWIITQSAHRNEIASECWFETTPSGSGSAVAIAANTLQEHSADPPVIRRLFDPSAGGATDPDERFRSRPSRFTFAFALGLWTVINVLVNVLSRRRWALYRALGARWTDVIVMQFSRDTLRALVAVGLGCLALGAWWSIDAPPDVYRPALQAGLAQVGLLLTLIPLASVLSAVSALGTSIVVGLRD